MTDQWGVGSKAQDKAFDTAKLQNGETVELVFGEHPHSRRDNNIYARWSDGRVEAFDGHRIRTRVELEEWNYLKMSGLSGNEVREGGTGNIYFNDRLVHSFFFRRIESALRQAERLVEQLKDHPARLWEWRDGHPSIIGRKVYYHGIPATVKTWWADQGAVCLSAAAPESTFPRMPWHDREEPEAEIKDDLLSPHIWWFRD